MKKIQFLFYSTFFLIITSCAQTTSTPEEYMNTNKIDEDIYKKDLILLTDAIKAHYDSINNKMNTRSKIKLIDVRIDTIFYGKDDKIAFLVLLKKENNYAKKEIQYAGECYIGYKTENIKNLYQLKYSSTSIESFEDVSKKNRNIYLGEMNYIEGSFNINDIRFWNSDIWDEKEDMEKKQKELNEIKKTNPNDVYLGSGLRQ